MTCADCGHPAHAGRCEIWTAVVDRTKDLEPTQCPCTTRRKTDGLDTDAEPSDAPAAAVAVDASAKGLRTMLGAALERDSGAELPA